MNVATLLATHAASTPEVGSRKPRMSTLPEACQAMRLMFTCISCREAGARTNGSDIWLLHRHLQQNGLRRRSALWCQRSSLHLAGGCQQQQSVAAARRSKERSIHELALLMSVRVVAVQPSSPPMKVASGFGPAAGRWPGVQPRLLY